MKKMTMLSKQNTMTSTLVAIPIYNECEYIDNILQSVRQYADHILAINDGSTDGTSGLLSKHKQINVITHQQNMGYGQSLIDAFAYAHKNHFDWIITIDCDHQHQPSYIPEFIRQIQTNNADIISGSRYLKPIDQDNSPPPPERVMINKKITNILNDHLNLNLTDSFCGFKAYRVKPLSDLDLTEKGYGLPLQLWVRAAHAQLSIREIPVPLIYYDPKRNFNETLADPKLRLNYYLQILEKELPGITPRQFDTLPDMRIPQERDKIFVHPAFTLWPQLIKANRTNTKNLLGRNHARNELLALARNYTKNICPISDLPNQSTPIIVTGHQATWHHCGIWTKDVVATQCARNIDGCAVHLLLDHDICDTSLTIPTQNKDGYWSFKKIDFEPEKLNIPLEFRPAPSKENLEQTINNLSNTIDAIKIMNIIRQRPRGLNNIADFITYVQANLSRPLGIKSLYLPVSQLAMSNAFLDFTIDIIDNALEFAQIYNQSIEQINNPKAKRKINALPYLSIDSTENTIELPFWLVFPTGKRLPLKVHPKNKHQIHLYADSLELGVINQKSAKPKTLQLRDILRQNEFRLRPKAVSLTLFTRLNLADWFIHGIGGAGYERVGDYLSEQYYRLGPLAFGVATATVTLPLSGQHEPVENISSLQQQLHRLKHNPEKYIPDEICQAEPVSTYIHSKNILLKIMAQNNLSAAKKKSTWSVLNQTNDLLLDHAQVAQGEIIKKIEASPKAEESKRVVNYREYFFGLFSERRLQQITKT